MLYMRPAGRDRGVYSMQRDLTRAVQRSAVLPIPGLVPVAAAPLLHPSGWSHIPLWLLLISTPCPVPRSGPGSIPLTTLAIPPVPPRNAGTIPTITIPAP